MRQALLGRLFARVTAAEADFVRRLLTGELRQGALAGLMVDAIASASTAPLLTVRRAAMLSGDLGCTARLALVEGEAALDATGGGDRLLVRFFDVLHADGEDLIDEPLSARHAVLDRLVGELGVPRVVTDDVHEAEQARELSLATGHEGVVVKAIDSPYDAGRRGGSWRKVKPVRTLDLVVLAAEWGHGRRQGWLSNLWLGARDPEGGFVMVGKTFKGLTDSLLTWQTAALLEREVSRDGIVVHVRPELVVEVALDGVQSSTRYQGGVALRFARVKGYRADKDAPDVDDIATVQAMLPSARA